MNCPHCSSTVVRLVLTLTNTDKYYCRGCKKYFYFREHPQALSGKTFIVRKHHNKEAMFVRALAKAGYSSTLAPTKTTLFYLLDYDVLGTQVALETMRKKHNLKRFFIYPHAGRPSLINDIYPPWDGTTAQFVSSPGHEEVLRAFGYDKPIHVSGWQLSELRQFSATCARKVLFAPIHPIMSDEYLRVNADAFDRLYRLHVSGKIILTVRYLTSLELSGVPQKEGIEYIKGVPDSSCDYMHEYDCIVASQTFAFISVAQGVPTIMIGEDVCPHTYKKNDKSINRVKSWEKYKDLLRYPIDITDASDTMVLIEQTCKSDGTIADWRNRMIGDAFDADGVVSSIEKYL